MNILITAAVSTEPLINVNYWLPVIAFGVIIAFIVALIMVIAFFDGRLNKKGLLVSSLILCISLGIAFIGFNFSNSIAEQNNSKAIKALNEKYDLTFEDRVVNATWLISDSYATTPDGDRIKINLEYNEDRNDIEVYVESLEYKAYEKTFSKD